MCGLVVESGEPRETMHFALLLGYGAAAVSPYLVLEAGCPPPAIGERVPGARALVGAAGLLKVCSKMGISTVQSYRGAQIFEAVGLGAALVDATSRAPSRASAAIGARPSSHAAAAARHARGVRRPGRRARPRGRRRVPLPRRAASTTCGSPSRSCGCSGPCATTSRATFRDYAERGRRARRPGSRRCAACSSRRRPARRSPLDEVEPATRDRAPVRHRRDEPGLDLARGPRDARDRDEPARRRARTPARAARIPARSIPDANGDLRRSAIKQVASGALRRHGRLPGRRRRAPDQDRPGRQARRGRPAARPQGRRARSPACATRRPASG